MSKLERRYGKDTVSFVGSLPGFASSSNCPAQPQFWANLAAGDCGPAEAEGSDDDLRGLEILLVEDSQGVADALKQHLELLGAVAGPAATTAEATKLTTERLPHVALVDFHLRGGDSSGLIGQLRGEGVPVIMLSGSFEFPAPVLLQG